MFYYRNIRLSTISALLFFPYPHSINQFSGWILPTPRSTVMLHAHMHSVFLQNIDMLSCKCLVHASYCAKFTTHGAGIIMLRFALVPDTFCCFRIHGAFPLCLPVKLSSGICHLVIIHRTVHPDRWTAVLSYLPQPDQAAHVPVPQP